MVPKVDTERFFTDDAILRWVLKLAARRKHLLDQAYRPRGSAPLTSDQRTAHGRTAAMRDREVARVPKPSAFNGLMSTP